MMNMAERVELLQNAENYAPDSITFNIHSLQDSVRAEEIKGYFNIDSIVSNSSTTWEKTIALAKFVPICLSSRPSGRMYATNPSIRNSPRGRAAQTAKRSPLRNRGYERRAPTDEPPMVATTLTGSSFPLFYLIPLRKLR